MFTTVISMESKINLDKVFSQYKKSITQKISMADLLARSFVGDTNQFSKDNMKNLPLFSFEKPANEDEKNIKDLLLIIAFLLEIYSALFTRYIESISGIQSGIIVLKKWFECILSLDSYFTSRTLMPTLDIAVSPDCDFRKVAALAVYSANQIKTIYSLENNEVSSFFLEEAIKEITSLDNSMKNIFFNENKKADQKCIGSLATVIGGIPVLADSLNKGNVIKFKTFGDIKIRNSKKGSSFMLGNKKTYFGIMGPLDCMTTMQIIIFELINIIEILNPNRNMIKKNECNIDYLKLVVGDFSDCVSKLLIEFDTFKTHSEVKELTKKLKPFFDGLSHIFGDHYFNYQIESENIFSAKKAKQVKCIKFATDIITAAQALTLQLRIINQSKEEFFISENATNLAKLLGLQLPKKDLLDLKKQLSLTEEQNNRYNNLKQEYDKILLEKQSIEQRQEKLEIELANANIKLKEQKSEFEGEKIMYQTQKKNYEKQLSDKNSDFLLLNQTKAQLEQEIFRLKFEYESNIQGRELKISYYEEQIEKANKKVKDLEEKIALLDNKYNTEKKEYENIKSNLENIKHEKEKRIEELDEKLITLEKDLNEKSKILDTQKKIYLDNEILLKDKIEKLGSENIILQKEKSLINLDIEGLNREKEEYLSNELKLNEQIKDLEEKMIKYDQVKSILEKEKNSFDIQIKEIEESYFKKELIFKEKIEDLEKALEISIRKKKISEDEIQRMKEESTDMIKKIKDLNIENNKIKKEYEDQNTAYKDQLLSLESQKENIVKMIEESNILQKQVESLKAEIKGLKENDYEIKIMGLEHDLRDQIEKYEKIMAEKNDYEIKIMGLKHDLRDQIEKYEKIIAEKNSLVEKNELIEKNYIEKLTYFKNKVETEKTDAAIAEAINEKTNNYEIRIMDLKHDLRDQIEKYEKIMAEKNDYEIKIMGLKHDLRDQIEKYEKIIAEKNSLVEKNELIEKNYIEKINILQKQVKSLQVEIKDYKDYEIKIMGLEHDLRDQIKRLTEKVDLYRAYIKQIYEFFGETQNEFSLIDLPLPAMVLTLDTLNKNKIEESANTPGSLKEKVKIDIGQVDLQSIKNFTSEIKEKASQLEINQETKDKVNQLCDRILDFISTTVSLEDIHEVTKNCLSNIASFLMEFQYREGVENQINSIIEFLKAKGIKSNLLDILKEAKLFWEKSTESTPDSDKKEFNKEVIKKTIKQDNIIQTEEEILSLLEGNLLRANLDEKVNEIEESKNKIIELNNRILELQKQFESSKKEYEMQIGMKSIEVSALQIKNKDLIQQIDDLILQLNKKENDKEVADSNEDDVQEMKDDFSMLKEMGFNQNKTILSEIIGPSTLEIKLEELQKENDRLLKQKKDYDNNMAFNNLMISSLTADKIKFSDQLSIANNEIANHINRIRELEEQLSKKQQQDVETKSHMMKMTNVKESFQGFLSKAKDFVAKKQ